MINRLRDQPWTAWSTIAEAGYWIKARYGAELQAIKLLHKDNYWLGVVEVKFADCNRVGFVVAETLEGCVYMIGYRIDRRQMKWKKSKY